jgi:hypothetical protein
MTEEQYSGIIFHLKIIFFAVMILIGLSLR